MESKALKELRNLKQTGFSVFLQDKSSRFVIAKKDLIEDKVDMDLDDSTRYTKLEEDDTHAILLQIESWWSRNKSHLTTLDEDISNWLINPDSKPGKMKVLLKTHKPNLPVREVFSVCSQPVERLSSFPQHSYLGPIVNSGNLQWRLRDTKEFIQFIHSFNDHIRDLKITTPISLCSVDIKNMFPSVFKTLAFPAIKQQLEKRGHSVLEIKAVLEALEIVRDGTRVKWKEDIIKQVDGCSLGPSDSCDYCDIALDSFLQLLIPRLEATLQMDLSWFRFFRDDGILFFHGQGQLVLDMLDILNQERDELTFTTEFCQCGNVQGCCSICPVSIPYLDCLVSVYQEQLEDGSLISQIKTVTYSKETDIHHYINPSSCTPKLTKKSPAIIKGVAHRLRLTNMLDSDLLVSLNTFSGYLEASGYDRGAIIQHFVDILQVSNRSLAFHTKEPDTHFKVALVTQLHPALPNLNKIFEKFYPVIGNCPYSSVIFPRDSLITASRKLPPLSSILCGNPFSNPKAPSSPKGFFQTPGCKCKICKEGHFTSIIHSPNFPDRGFSIPEPTSCRAQNVVYVISCPCGLQYVGKTGQPRPRWANHKSHVRNSHRTCNLASHCMNIHKDTMVGTNKLMATQDIHASLQFTILQSVGSAGSYEDLEELEEQWRNRLQSWD